MTTLAEANSQQEPEVYAYSTWRLLLQLVGLGAGSALLLLGPFLWPGTGSPLSKLLVCAVGVWGTLYVIRRLRNPRRFILNDAVVRGEYWSGARRSWNRESLRVKEQGLGSLWESSTVVGLLGGDEAFRLYRDLPGYDRFRSALQGNGSY